MRITSLIAICLTAGLVTACTQAPLLDDRISDQARDADFPTLIALEGPAVTDVGATNSAEVIDELDNRTDTLWARIEALF